MKEVWIARATLELQSPFRIGTGEGDGDSDATFVADAEGRPSLPGTSLAGVLRAAYRSDRGEAQADDLFGVQRGSEGRASRLAVSWGQLHDGQDRPLPLRGPDPPGDPILGVLRAGWVRDHVRLDQRLVADDRGKFNERLVPAGARFTFELRVQDPEPGETEALVTCLGGLRLGAGTRRGLGQARLVALVAGTFSNRTRDWPDPDLTRPCGLLKPVATKPYRPRWGEQVVLRPEAGWRFGGGAPIDADDEQPDLLPVYLPAVVWSDQGRAKIAYRPALPGTALKGALRHRLIYHYRRLTETDWSDGGERSPAAEPSAVTDLLGEIKGNDRQDRSRGRAGRIFFQDGQLHGDFAPGDQAHVTLDRLTQGPMDGLLFQERQLFGGELVFTWSADRDPFQGPPTLKRAWQATLDDLCQGRLALGAAGARGHGFFTGEVTRW